MFRKGKFILKAATFLLVLGIVVTLTNRILIPKYFYNNLWPTTSTYLGFYEMDKDTVDVIFLGSSHAASSFSPQVLYNTYGITSYNLGCEQQNLLVSYYWLKEALRYQSPKAVVLDCYMLFPYQKEEPLNSAESCIRKAIDFMRWSPVKWEAVQAICEADEGQSLSSYILPNIRFHSRWTQLNEEDFTFSEMSRHYELKGFTAIQKHSGSNDYQPFSSVNDAEGETMVEIMEEYLEKITNLCKEEEISLILVKTPSVFQNINRYCSVKNYAEKQGLNYIDFNEEELYRKIDYQFSVDNSDGGHGSIWGATKMTSYVGYILHNQYGVEEHRDEQWENTKEYYEGIIQDYTIKTVTDMETYLDLLKDERYWIFMAVRDEAVRNLDDRVIVKIKELGLEAKLEGNQQCSYYAIRIEGEWEEAAGYEKLEKVGRMRKGWSNYYVASAGYECGNMCSIKIDGREYGQGRRGLNIVIYNPVTKTVIDSICFDSYLEEQTAYRE